MFHSRRHFEIKPKKTNSINHACSIRQVTSFKKTLVEINSNRENFPQLIILQKANKKRHAM